MYLIQIKSFFLLFYVDQILFLIFKFVLEKSVFTRAQPIKTLDLEAYQDTFGKLS